MKPIVMALCLSMVGIVPVAAHAAQIKTPTVSTPHVNIRTNVSGTPTAKGGGKVSTQDLHVTKTVDKSSPNLFKGVVTGKHISTGTITARRAQ